MLYLLKILFSLAALVGIPIALFIILPEIENNKHQAFAIGGAIMTWGIAYKMLGALDLIPDWLPIVGKLDDMIVGLIILIGIGVGTFGHFVL